MIAVVVTRYTTTNIQAYGKILIKLLEYIERIDAHIPKHLLEISHMDNKLLDVYWSSEIIDTRDCDDFRPEQTTHGLSPVKFFFKLLQLTV